MSPASDEALANLIALHEEVDHQAAALQELHADRLQCRRGCASCCVDDLSVFEVEAVRIRIACADVLAEAPHGPGGCAFLDAEGACRIYDHRPYVCRTQGLPLRWADPDQPGIERRDICPLNEAGAPVETLPAGACWELGPVEARLAAMDGRGGPRARVRLRDLFTPADADPIS